MKKLASLLMAALMAGSVIAASALTVSAADNSYGEVPLYKGGITVDGKIDEAYTKLGLKIDASKDYNASLPSGVSKADVYVLHDGSYLYFCYDVTAKYAIDPENYNEAKASSANAWNTTAVEHHIDWSGNAKTNGLWAKPMLWLDGRVFCAEFEGKETEIVSEYKTSYNKDTNSYVLEVKMPFKGDAKAGSEIGFYTMVTVAKDWATGGQDTIGAPTEGLANGFGKLWTITLSGTEVKLPAAATTTETTPATFDAAVIFAAVAAVAGAGVVVTKKKH